MLWLHVAQRFASMLFCDKREFMPAMLLDRHFRVWRLGSNVAVRSTHSNRTIIFDRLHREKEAKGAGKLQNGCRCVFRIRSLLPTVYLTPDNLVLSDMHQRYTYQDAQSFIA